MKRQLTKFSIIVCIFLSTPTVYAENLADYLEEALTANDTLQSARARFRISSEKSRQTGVLPDPKLSVQYYLEPVETRTGPQNAAIGLSQSVPWFNKLSLLREIGDHNVIIAGAKLAAVELDVTRQVKKAYIEYAFLGRSQQTMADTLELLRYLEGVARSRYAGGKATFFDVLKIQIEMTKTQEKSDSLADRTTPLRVHINNLLGTEQERSRKIPDFLPEVTLKKNESSIHSLALQNAPLLQSARQSIAKARTAKDLAETAFYPDFNFSIKTILTGSAEYGEPEGSGNDPIIAGLNVNLPIFYTRRQAGVAEQVAAVEMAQSNQQQQQRLLSTHIEQELFSYREAERKLLMYRDDLLPKVKQQLEVAINGFQNGETTILELIDAEQNLLRFSLSRDRALADRAMAVARLESQVGVVLADWKTKK